MFRQLTLTIALAAGAVFAVGCANDKPHDYGTDRPPPDAVTPGDTGLQSKDVIAASDLMAQDLLALPDLNASNTRWTIVVTNVENQTSDPRNNLNIFLERLRVKLSQMGRGRIQLIENLAKLRELQSQELEGPPQASDQYGQSGNEPGGTPQPRGIQPDFGLYAKIMELPNRNTSYFYCEFTLTNLHTREQVWTHGYEVKTAR
jgi:PBP1b-binding outer membrane lipoprotein LpoB